MWKKIAMSILSGSTATLLYLSVAFILDRLMNDKTSNMVALLAGACLNFILQRKTFMEKTVSSQAVLMKFIISEVLILGSAQMGVASLLDNKQKYQQKLPVALQKYYNTIVRMFVATVIFVLISFPIRNYWVFIV